MNDRITVTELHPENLSPREKVGKAMGWRLFERSNTESGYKDMWWFPKGENPKSGYPSHPIPDPFTDANDDVAVNEWAVKNLDPDAYFAALSEVVGSYCYLHEYRTGYFARAALKVIE